MNVLIVGSGGREHALAHHIGNSPSCKKIYVMPGNAGTATIAHNLIGNVLDFKSISEAILANDIQLVVIGPDDPLAAGVVDYLRVNNSSVAVVGPNQKAAQLECSKIFSKKFMLKNMIATAKYEVFEATQMIEAKKYVTNHQLPIVIKADGLALGKGVVICQTHEEALVEVEQMLNGKFGEASKNIVVEQFLKGIEMSCFVLTDGKNYYRLPDAKDYKRQGNNDTGLNTGGMGAVSPVVFCDEELNNKIIKKIITPTIEGLKSETIDYCGFIFFGLMVVDGEPYLIEYNTRLGDPETEVILPRINDDLLPYLLKAANGTLNETTTCNQKNDTAVAVINISLGYPLEFEKDKNIAIEPLTEHEIIYQMGTKIKDEKYVTNGGRVLAAVGLGSTLEAAIQRAYGVCNKIKYANKWHRSDIGNDLINIKKK